VGHSLGGALASLLGATYGLPAVAFESPGEKLAASRLHLPLPPPILPSHPSAGQISLPSTMSLSTSQISIPSSAHFPPPGHHPIATTHVYHNADPIPQGTCTGFGSACTHAGYALETRCHLGKSIVFDTVGKLGWSVDVRHHVIKEVITSVLDADGDEDETGVSLDNHQPQEDGDWAEIIAAEFRKRKGGNSGQGDKKRERAWPGNSLVPKPIIEEGCVDCYKWEFGDFLEDKEYE